MLENNLLFIHSGGPTATLNVTLQSMISSWQNSKLPNQKFFISKNGFLGILEEDFITVANNFHDQSLAQSPAAFSGSCRYKLNKESINKIIKVCTQKNITKIIVNGGGDSMLNLYNIKKIITKQNINIQCIGIPKTIDNDLFGTDVSPGFGSAAKYLATSAMEIAWDLMSMHKSSTKIFCLEVMGRHTGWLAAATSVLQNLNVKIPQIILIPEIDNDIDEITHFTNDLINKYGFCMLTISEGIKINNKYISDHELKDPFGHKQLGGVGRLIANYLQQKLNFKTHLAIPDYCQRSARHIASQTDVYLAKKAGEAAFNICINSNNDGMIGFNITQYNPIKCEIQLNPLDKVANLEKPVPSHFIDKKNFNITKAGVDYFNACIQGESYPSYKNGLPEFIMPGNIV